jgi:hypothetical protein
LKDDHSASLSENAPERGALLGDFGRCGGTDNKTTRRYFSVERRLWMRKNSCGHPEDPLICVSLLQNSPPDGRHFSHKGSARRKAAEN